MAFGSDIFNGINNFGKKYQGTCPKDDQPLPCASMTDIIIEL